MALMITLLAITICRYNIDTLPKEGLQSIFEEKVNIIELNNIHTSFLI